MVTMETYQHSMDCDNKELMTSIKMIEVPHVVAMEEDARLDHNLALQPATKPGSTSPGRHPEATITHTFQLSSPPQHQRMPHPWQPRPSHWDGHPGTPEYGKWEGIYGCPGNSPLLESRLLSSSSGIRSRDDPFRDPSCPGASGAFTNALRQHYGGRPTHNKKLRTPRTLTRLMQQHRENERHRHHGLNANIKEISKHIPGYDEACHETKIVKLQRIISYICHLEEHIQGLCESLGLDLEFKNLFLLPHIPKPESITRRINRATPYTRGEVSTSVITPRLEAELRHSRTGSTYKATTTSRKKLKLSTSPTFDSTAESALTAIASGTSSSCSHIDDFDDDVETDGLGSQQPTAVEHGNTGWTGSAKETCPGKPPGPSRKRKSDWLNCGHDNDDMLLTLPLLTMDDYENVMDELDVNMSVREEAEKEVMRLCETSELDNHFLPCCTQSIVEAEEEAGHSGAPRGTGALLPDHLDTHTQGSSPPEWWLLPQDASTSFESSSQSSAWFLEEEVQIEMTEVTIDDTDVCDRAQNSSPETPAAATAAAATATPLLPWSQDYHLEEASSVTSASDHAASTPARGSGGGISSDKENQAGSRDVRPMADLGTPRSHHCESDGAPVDISASASKIISLHQVPAVESTALNIKTSDRSDMTMIDGLDGNRLREAGGSVSGVLLQDATGSDCRPAESLKSQNKIEIPESLRVSDNRKPALLQTIKQEPVWGDTTHPGSVADPDHVDAAPGVSSADRIILLKPLEVHPTEIPASPVERLPCGSSAHDEPVSAVVAQEDRENVSARSTTNSSRQIGVRIIIKGVGYSTEQTLCSAPAGHSYTDHHPSPSPTKREPLYPLSNTQERHMTEARGRRLSANHSGHATGGGAMLKNEDGKIICQVPSRRCSMQDIPLEGANVTPGLLTALSNRPQSTPHSRSPDNIPASGHKVRRVDHRKTSWMNGFMMYSRMHRKRYIDANPGLQTSLVSKLMGHDWRQLSAEHQAPYKVKAKMYVEQCLRNSDPESQSADLDLGAET